ncbi:MAG: TIGR04283 family arsenosugar biosynthesis glycosyltransferase [Blastocatellia bacterium]
MPPTISIIIPVLNEEALLAGTLDGLRRFEGEPEVIVVDGGSHDLTCDIARTALQQFSQGQLIESARGRGPQMNAGAHAAQGNVLLFLHADTQLPADAITRIKKVISNPEIVGGNFAIAFEGRDLWSRVFTRLYNWRRRFGIYYGDSAIFARREVFERLGGFLDAPVMEDYDFCRKLERAVKTSVIESPAITSSRRWGRWGTAYVLTVWVLLQWLYLIGARPEGMGWIYYPKSFKLRRKRAVAR